MKRKEQYQKNKSQAVGTIITCPICKCAFMKKQYAQAFCSADCKNKFWNDKKDRHTDPNYYTKYNMKHSERLERIGIVKEMGEFGYIDENGMFRSFKEDFESRAMCENPILGI